MAMNLLEMLCDTVANLADFDDPELHERHLGKLNDALRRDFGPGQEDRADAVSKILRWFLQNSSGREDFVAAVRRRPPPEEIAATEGQPAEIIDFAERLKRLTADDC